MAKLIPDLNVTLATSEKAWDKATHTVPQGNNEMQKATEAFKKEGYSTVVASSDTGDVEYFVGIREDVLDNFMDSDHMCDLVSSIGCTAWIYWFNLISAADIVTPSSKGDFLTIFQEVIDSMTMELFDAIDKAQKDRAEKRKEERRAQRKAKKAGKEAGAEESSPDRVPVNRVEEKLEELGIEAEVTEVDLGDGFNAVTVAPKVDPIEPHMQSDDTDGDAPKIDFNL